MGSCFSCLEKQNSISEPLFTNIYCPQCNKFYTSNNEYNKHIFSCNKNKN